MHRSLAALLAACLLPAARILCHAHRCLRSLLYATRAAFHAGRDSVDARCGWFRQYRFLRQGAVLGCMRHQALAVNFQEVVHSAQAVNAEVAKHQRFARTEWTRTRMLL